LKAHSEALRKRAHLRPSYCCAEKDLQTEMGTIDQNDVIFASRLSSKKSKMTEGEGKQHVEGARERERGIKEHV
jgi:hypothetical protein